MDNKIQEVIKENPERWFLPIKENKAFYGGKTWSKTDRLEYKFDGCYGLGLICGAISGGVEVIDIDLKYDLTGTLFERFKKAINKSDKELLKLLTVQKTVNNGYHFIYTCVKRTGNISLARRFPTTDEKELKNEKVKVLIETRGDGGYIACYPTKGYDMVYGDFKTIKEITPEQRMTLFEVARTFNEYFEEFKPTIKTEKKVIKGKTSFEDYNERGDVITILVKHGWTVVGRKGEKILLKRPGETSASHSGNFDEDKRWFSVFSTSTQFEPEKGYLPYAVYGVLEHNSDWNETGRDLYHQGFGERFEKVAENVIGTPSKIDKLSDDMSFLATRKHVDDYLRKVRNGTFELGKSTGIPELDEFFRIKDGNFVVINGHDNVGKSVIIWYLALLTALLYDWKWIIYSSENTVGFFYRKMIEFYWNKPLPEIDPRAYDEALTFIETHFEVILSSDELFNGQEIIDMAEKVINRQRINGLMVDPYNSLKIDLVSTSKLSTHEYHYEQVSKFKLFGKQKNLSIYINCHAVTDALRKKDNQNMGMAPQKADTEGGSKFGNKADDFLTIHRKVQSKEEWMITELHVRKIKETETGGRITPQSEPVKLKAVNYVTGFICVKTGYNPIENYHKNRLSDSQSNLFKPSKIEPMPEVAKQLEEVVEQLYHEPESIYDTKQPDGDLPF